MLQSNQLLPLFVGRSLALRQERVDTSLANQSALTAALVAPGWISPIIARELAVRRRPPEPPPSRLEGDTGGEGVLFQGSQLGSPEKLLEQFATNLKTQIQAAEARATAAQNAALRAAEIAQQAQREHCEIAKRAKEQFDQMIGRIEDMFKDKKSSMDKTIKEVKDIVESCTDTESMVGGGSGRRARTFSGSEGASKS
jgi:hypothetical protein